MDLTILLSLWHGWRDLYSVEQVKAMSRMLRAHIQLPFRIALLTDDEITAEQAEVDAVYPGTKDPDGLKLYRSTVNCFRRLRYFDANYTRQFGTPWVMSVDMDILLWSDITDIVEYGMHEFGFCINRAKGGTNRPYNGSMYMIKVGEHQHVWDEFDPVQSPIAMSKTRQIGSDQTWIGMQIKGAPTIGPEHGMYYLGEYRKRMYTERPRIVTCSGAAKPWSRMCLNQAPEVFREYVQWMDNPPIYGQKHRSTRIPASV